MTIVSSAVSTLVVCLYDNYTDNKTSEAKISDFRRRLEALRFASLESVSLEALLTVIWKLDDTRIRPESGEIRRSRKGQRGAGRNKEYDPRIPHCKHTI